jgi:ABC-2 type transport system permease protein
VVLAMIGVDSVWNPGLNLAAVISDGARYYADVPCEGPGGGSCAEERVLSLERAVVFLGALLAAGVAASLYSFHRRDVP